MGTFSRSLEQPTYIPAHIQYGSKAPSINNLSASAPPAAAAVDSYYGNNDAAGSSGPTIVQDLINPSFLTTRVMTTITKGRNDGTDLALGEPLVKKRFSLQRLAWLTYKGASASNLTDPNIMQLITAMGGDPSNASDPVYQLVAQGNAANILKYFGLTWSLGTGVMASGATEPPGWTYSHGSTHIMNLSEVAAANREPDFAELLKAAINVGSLAEGGPNLHPEQGNYQYVVDTSIDYNVLQIMANLIDQFDLDSYPTIIKFAFGSTTRYIRGVEDLPYFYRYHPMMVVSRLPKPFLTSSSTVAFTFARTGAAVETDSPCAPLSPSVTPDPGQAVYLYVPDLWNPHDPSVTLSNNTAPRPTNFRLAVLSTDPTEQTPDWSPYLTPGYYQAKFTLTATTPIPPSSDNSKPLDKEAFTAFTFSDNGGKLFREPTLLYRTDAPSGVQLGIDAGDSSSLAGPYTDAFTGVVCYGVQIASMPMSFVGTIPSTYAGNPSSDSRQYVFQTSSYGLAQNTPTNSYPQYTFRLQYKDPNGSGKWVTYDEKYPDFHGLYPVPTLVTSKQIDKDAYQNFYALHQMNDSSTAYDPRTARFGIGTEANLGQSTSAFEEPGAYGNELGGSQSVNDAFAAAKPTIVTTQRPGSDRGNQVNYSNPGMTSNPGKNSYMRWFGGAGYSASNGDNASPLEWSGLFAQNDSRLIVQARNGPNTHLYYEDADGMNRRAMGAYVLQSTNSTISTSYQSSNQEGLPDAIAQSYAGGSLGVGTGTVQSLSRPIVLNRPFHSVAEMSYASRGGTWKQIDFFTPESGDTALLDVFCVAEPPAGLITAGKINLNTHQKPVIQALVANAVRDELNNLSSAPSYKLSAVTGDEAANVAKQLVNISTDTTDAWRGPLTNTGDLVGRFIPGLVSAAGATDLYQYTEPITGSSYTYAGLSAALDSNVYTANAYSGSAYTLPSGATINYTTADNYKIQRMRESAIRGLADSGQTRVWNLMIDVVAQTGRYAPNATALAQFNVDGESRYWIHVAIDRYTGAVIDKQIEVVNE